QRPDAEPGSLLCRLAGDAGAHSKPHVAARWSALGAARVHTRRRSGAVREGRTLRCACAPVSAARATVRGAGEAETRLGLASPGGARLFRRCLWSLAAAVRGELRLQERDAGLLELPASGSPAHALYLSV